MIKKGDYVEMKRYAIAIHVKVHIALIMFHSIIRGKDAGRLCGCQTETIDGYFCKAHNEN